MVLKSARQSLDTVANVAAIVLCLVVCGLLAVQTVDKRRQARLVLSALPPVLPLGTVLQSSDDIDYGSRELTVLVGLSPSCKYCTESMPAFRDLERRLRGSRGQIGLVAVGLRSADTISEYLAANGVTGFRSISVTRQSHLAPLVSRTPSVVIIDRKGMVRATWPGLITTERLADIIGEIRRLSS